MYTKSNLSIPLTADQRSVLVGTVLGDSSLTASRHAKPTACLRFSHGPAQSTYAEWKAAWFYNMSNRGVRPQRTRRQGCPDGYLSFRFTTRYTADLFQWYEYFYRNRVKLVPDDLGAILTPLSLAVWYMDDGSIETRKQNRPGRQTYVHNAIALHTNGFTKHEVETLASVIFDKFGIRFSVKSADKKQHHILKLKSRVVIARFFELIRPYIIPSMEYKLRTSYEKRMRRPSRPERLLRVIKTLHLTKYTDFIKYRRGRSLYEKVKRRFQSVSNAVALIAA